MACFKVLYFLLFRNFTSLLNTVWRNFSFDPFNLKNPVETDELLSEIMDRALVSDLSCFAAITNIQLNFFKQRRRTTKAVNT